MTSEKFFRLVSRVNTILIFLLLVVFIGLYLWNEVRWRSYQQSNVSHSQYGAVGLVDEPNFAGEHITTPDGVVVKYVIDEARFEGRDIAGSNVSLTAMAGGKSRLVLPEGSDKLILRFLAFGPDGEDDKNVSAYLAFIGTPKDFENGVMDVVLGRLSDLEQVVLKERIRFVDAPLVQDDGQIALIVWPTTREARYWTVDLDSFGIVDDRPIDVPREMSDAILEKMEAGEDAIAALMTRP